jgi:hypothetical protein
MGTTTATPIFPPCDKPPEVAELAGLVCKGGAPVEEEDRLAAEGRVNKDVGCAVGAAVEVMTTVKGVPAPPVDAGLAVMTEVTTTTGFGGGGGGTDGGGMTELAGAAEEETSTAEDEGAGVKVELD